jgi:hypothetical protein
MRPPSFVRDRGRDRVTQAHALEMAAAQRSPEPHSAGSANATRGAMHAGASVARLALGEQRSVSGRQTRSHKPHNARLSSATVGGMVPVRPAEQPIPGTLLLAADRLGLPEEPVHGDLRGLPPALRRARRFPGEDGRAEEASRPAVVREPGTAGMEGGVEGQRQGPYSKRQRNRSARLSVSTAPRSVILLWT